MKNIADYEWRNPSFLLVSFGLEALGIRHLASLLKGLKCKVHILFLEHSLNEFLSYSHSKLVADFVIKNDYDIVGFSCMTGDYYEIRSITQTIKKSNKRPTIIWGGVHPSVCPEECLIDGGADIVFKGAAESSLRSLIQGSSLKDVKNIAWVEGEEIVINYSDIIILPPDLMPFPDYEFNDHFIINNNEISNLDMKTFMEKAPWGGSHYFAITARGCPYHCAYCCNIYRGNFERKSVDYFLEELSYIKKKMPFKTLSIQDDSLFLQNNSWITEFATKYRKNINKPLRAALMPRFATLDKLEPLAEAGLTYIGMGLQGSSRLNRDIYGRKETRESFLQAVSNYRKFGIIGRIDVIVDNPYEQEEDLREIAYTLNEVPKPFPICVFNLTLFPGTRMAKMAGVDGLTNKFAGDPYFPSLFHRKNNGEIYKTPEHWVRLYSDYLPNMPKKICNYLIRNSYKKDIQKNIIRYSKWGNTIRTIGTRMRRLSPETFDRGLKYLHKVFFAKT